MSESHTLSHLANRLVVLFVITNMLSLGMSLTLKEIIAPLRNLSLTLKALLANFVIVPIVGYLLVQVMPLAPGRAIGLILLATAAGEPFLTKLSQMSKGDPAYTLALLVMLEALTVFYMPVVVPLLLPGVKVDPLAIAKPLIVLMIIPLVIGLFVKARYEKTARVLCVPLDRFSSVVVAVALMLFIIIHFKAMIATLGSRAILTGAIFIWIAFAVGYFLGGPLQVNKSILGLGTSGRGFSAVLVVIVSNFAYDPEVLLMVVITLAVTMITLIPTAATILHHKNVLAAKS